MEKKINKMGLFNVKKKEETKEELEQRLKDLDDLVKVQYFSSPIGIGWIIGAFSNNEKKTRERLADARTEIRMRILGLDIRGDYDKYLEIKKEEEGRFDEKFGKKDKI